MADGLGEGGLTALDGEIPVLVGDGTGASTVRTGGLLGQGLGLLVQQGGEGALGQAGGGGLSYLLQGREVGIQGRAGVAEGAAGYDPPPLRGQITDLLHLLLRERM